MNKQSLKHWLAKHGPSIRLTGDCESGPDYDRLIEHDGVIYDPDRMPLVHHVTDEDHEQFIYRADDGRFVVEHCFRGLDQRGAGTFANMAVFNVAIGLFASLGVLLGAQPPVGLSAMVVPLFGLMAGLAMTVLTVPIFAGLICGIKQAGVLDTRFVIDGYSELPLYAQRDLPVLCAMKGYSHDDLIHHDSWTEWRSGVPETVELIEPGPSTQSDEYIIRRSRPGHGKELATVDRDALKKRLLKQDRFALYKRVFGRLPYPDRS